MYKNTFYLCNKIYGIMRQVYQGPIPQTSYPAAKIAMTKGPFAKGPFVIAPPEI